VSRVAVFNLDLNQINCGLEMLSTIFGKLVASKVNRSVKKSSIQVLRALVGGPTADGYFGTTPNRQFARNLGKKKNIDNPTDRDLLEK
jgi:hypothetical protein